MHDLPFPARGYMVLIWLIAACIGVYLLPTVPSLIQAPLISLLGLIGYALAWYGEISFTDQNGNRVAWTVDEAVCLLLITIFGSSGIWLIALSFTCVGLLRRRPWERLLFNLAMLVISYSLAALVYRVLQPADSIPFGSSLGPFTFISTAGTYYLSNLTLISMMIALASRQPILRIYQHNLRQVDWVQLLIFTIGATMAALYAINPWLLIYGVLTLILARHAFATVAALNTETQRRTQLAEEQAQLYAERAHLAEALHTHQAELARAVKLAELGTFAAGIAHEFNNVLTAILGHAQVAKLSDTFAEKDYSLDIIARVSQRATGITASLLTFARQREPELELAPLQLALQETIQLVEPDLRHDQIRLVQQIDEVPPTLYDIGQVTQVLLNLITNARDALRGRPEPTIHVRLHREADAAVITIADNGPGIPPAILERLFQPFVTTKKKGNGLGMAICYGIVESHQGKINVISSAAYGTTIAISLPIRDMAGQLPETPTDPPADTTPALSGTAAAT
jgi:signal transduction histidine kinase